MKIVSFRASNNRFLVVNASGRLEASALAPDATTEFIVENLTRPESERYAVGDRLEIRSLANNNLWRLNPPPFGFGRDIPAVVVDRSSPAFSRTLSEVVEVTWVDPMGDTGTGMRLRLQGRYPYMVVPGGGGGSAPDAEAIFRDGAEMTQTRALFTGSDNLVSASSASATASSNFTVIPHHIRAALRTANGLYLTLNSDGRLVATAMDSGRLQEFTFLLDSATGGRPNLMHGDLLTLRASNGRQVNSGPSGIAATTDTGIRLQLRRLDSGVEVQDGDRVTLSQFELAASDRFEPRRLVFQPVGDGRSGRVHLIREAVSPNSTLIIELTRTLGLFWNDARQDNLTGIGTTGAGAYAFVRPQMRVLLVPRPNTVPLKSFFNESRGDTMTTATVQGENAALQLRPPYVFRGVLGYIYADSQVGTVPLKQYWNPRRGDNFICALPIDDSSAADAGYEFVCVEGHAPPAALPSAPTVRPGVGPARPITPVVPGGLVGGLLPNFPIHIAPARPRKALVLAGGGAKGCFEAGAVQELWNNGYRPDFICGVSVGAINASYLALGHDDAGNELVSQWREFSGGPGRIYRKEHYLNVIGKLADRVAGRAGDTALATAAGAGVGAAIGALIGFFSGAEASGIDGSMIRLINFLLTMTHAQHSMEPLRRLLQTTYNADYLRRLRESPIGLHVTMTDMKTGQLVTVSGPEADWHDSQIADCGRVFVEPDHQIGDTWLTSPVFGTPYVMPLVDAVYASSALPAFMEPLLIDLPQSRRVSTPAGIFTRLATQLPMGLRELIDVTNTISTRSNEEYLNGLDWAAVERVIDSVLARLPTAQLRTNVLMARSSRDGNRGIQSQTHLFFDGGLRDTLPIRTALRLGAQEITVITGDQLHRAQHTYPIARRLDPALAGGALDLIGGGAWHGSDFGATPLAQHVLGLLGLWFNEASRSDLMLSLEHSDQLGRLRRALDRMDSSSATAVRNAFRAEVSERTSTRYHATGATGPIGGNPKSLFPYGEPFSTPGPTIRLIAPDRGIIDPLDFENREAVEDGIALGAQRARLPVTL